MEEAMTLIGQLQRDLQSLFASARLCIDSPLDKPACGGFWIGVVVAGVAVALLIVYWIKRPPHNIDSANSDSHARPGENRKGNAKAVALYLLLIAPFPFLTVFTDSTYLNAEVCVLCGGLGIVAAILFLAPPLLPAPDDAHPESPARAASMVPRKKSESIGIKVAGFALFAAYFYLIALTVCFLLVRFFPTENETESFEVRSTYKCQVKCGFCKYRIYVEGWRWGTGSAYLCMSEDPAFPVNRGDSIEVDGTFYRFAAHVVNLRGEDR